MENTSFRSAVLFFWTEYKSRNAFGILVLRTGPALTNNAPPRHSKMFQVVRRCQCYLCFANLFTQLDTNQVWLALLWITEIQPYIRTLLRCWRGEKCGPTVPLWQTHKKTSPKRLDKPLATYFLKIFFVKSQNQSLLDIIKMHSKYFLNKTIHMNEIVKKASEMVWTRYQ